MSRTGLSKQQVKKARDTLLAQEKYPSVDAVRIELGNTGSKSTIHKYLKELEDEEGDVIAQPSISETLQNLVQRLSEQLHQEAQEKINVFQEQMQQREQECEKHDV